MTIEQTPLGTFEIRWGSAGRPADFPASASVVDMEDPVAVADDADRIVLRDPMYGDDQTLWLYRLRSNPDQLIAFAEITPGVYAQGVRVVDQS